MNEQWFPPEIGLSDALGCHMSFQTIHTRPSAGKPELEWLVWMKSREVTGRRELHAANLGGWGLGSLREGPCQSQKSGIPESSVFRENGEPQSGSDLVAIIQQVWQSLVWSDLVAVTQQGWQSLAQFFWLEAQSSFFFIKWWPQFSSFLGPRYEPLPSDPLCVLGFGKVRMSSGDTQHSISFHFHPVGSEANLLSIWIAALPLNNCMTLGKSLNLSQI